MTMHGQEALRWRATIVYRTEMGLVDVVHDVVDIDDLAQLVEDGFHIDTVDQVTFRRLNWIEDPQMTVEQSVRL